MTYSPLELAAAFIQTGELDDALAALNRHLDEQPGDDHVRRMRINVLRHLGQAEAALADFERLSSQTPDDVLNHSVLLQQADNPVAAMDLLAAACAQWPENERLTEHYVQLLMAAERFDRALVVVRQQPKHWRWLGWEGDLLAGLGDDITATARYSLALAQIGETPERWLGPMRARLLLARAHAYRRLEFYDQAEADYAAAEQIIPDDPMIPFMRGLLCCLQGDPETSLDQCRPAYAAASDALREQMRRELQGDERYATLLSVIEVGSS